jgi:hypothetical protein
LTLTASQGQVFINFDVLRIHHHWKNIILHLFLPKTGCYAPVASSTSKHSSASVFPAYGRKSKPPALRVVVDSSKSEAPKFEDL